MKALVTGATGFIGSHLTEELIKQGHKVKVLVRETEDSSKDKRGILGLLKKLNVEIIQGDLLDEKSLDNAVKNVDVVFHLAAIARPMAIPREEYFKVNEKGTKNLLEACKKKKIKKIVIMSSVSAVGQSKEGKAVNEKTKCKPVDTYGWSKLAQEKISLEYFKKFKMPIVFLRPPMVFGPRDVEMLKLFKAVKKRFFPLDGKSKCMEFLYVENLVQACLLAVKYGENGEAYHITNGEHYSINEIRSSMEKAMGKKVLPIKFPRIFFVSAGFSMELVGKLFGFRPPFKHDTIDWMTKKLWYSDVSKARKVLKYVPKFSLDEGIKKTVDYYKKEGYL